MITEKILIVSILLFMFSMAMGVTALPLVFLGEWMMPDTKAVTNICCVFVQNILIFFVVKGTPLIADALGMAIVFWSGALVCWALLFFAVKFIPETNGKIYAYSNVPKNPGQCKAEETETLATNIT